MSRLPAFPTHRLLALALAAVLATPACPALAGQQSPAAEHAMHAGAMAGMPMPASASSAASHVHPAVPAHAATTHAPAAAPPATPASAPMHAMHRMPAPPAGQDMSTPARGQAKQPAAAGHHHAMDMHAAPATPMPMAAPPTGQTVTRTRDPDYSDGVGYGPTHGIDMAMNDSAAIGMLLVDQLEAFHGRHGNGQQWGIEARYGNDYDKLWLSSDGERSGGRLEGARTELSWSHAVAAFWNTQLGVRADSGPGPDRQWAAVGLQGLAPYWFELEATGYLGSSGRTAARLHAQYELFFTQRLILQPDLELNAYGKADPARRLGSGLSDATVGLRLRYEIDRQFAPYLGITWTRRFGGTADFARQDGQGLLDRQWVAGVRMWF